MYIWKVDLAVYYDKSIMNNQKNTESLQDPGSLISVCVQGLLEDAKGVFSTGRRTQIINATPVSLELV